MRGEATGWVAGWAIGLLGLLGCGKSIGDPCILAVDCSTRGDRQCDTSMPDGYCTQLSCRANGCPSDSSCVLFGAALSGCSVNPREVSRAARSQCMLQCENNDDCRAGYTCRVPSEDPLRAQILDDNKSVRVCLANGRAATASEAQICKEPTADSIPAFPVIDAGSDGVDSGIPKDAGFDAAPLPTDAGADAADAR